MYQGLFCEVVFRNIQAKHFLPRVAHLVKRPVLFLKVSSIWLMYHLKILIILF